MDLSENALAPNNQQRSLYLIALVRVPIPHYFARVVSHSREMARISRVTQHRGAICGELLELTVKYMHSVTN